MGLKPDHWIKMMAEEHRMIEPFVDRQVRDGAISYGVSSYGYDMRVSDEFKIFTNVRSAIVDPKNFADESFVDFRGDVCIIPPNSFALSRSVEYFRIPRQVLTICLGKSTYARCGLIVNVTPFRTGVGRATSRWKSAIRRRCRPKSMPTKAWRRCCSSRRTTSASSPTPTRRASISGKWGSPRRACEAECP